MNENQLLSTPQKPLVSTFQKTVTVTPEYAAILLKNNTCNRPLSKNMVSKYAGFMSRNMWISLPQSRTITLNQKMQLCDGQHRLNAIIQSGVPQEMDIWQISSDDTALILPFDRGKTRSISEVTGLSPMVARVVNFLSFLSNKKLDIDQMIKFVNIFDEDTKIALSRIAEGAGAAYKVAIKAAIFYWYIVTGNEEYAFKAAERMLSDCADDIKITRIQRYVLSNRNAGGVARKEHFCLTYMLLDKGERLRGSGTAYRQKLMENYNNWFESIVTKI